jgi:hypothetical protein
MDHTPWEDEHSWWFDFEFKQHPYLVDAHRYPSDLDAGTSCIAQGELLDWLNQQDPTLWRYHNSGPVLLTIVVTDPNLAFAFNMRWRGTPTQNPSN